MLSSLLVLGSAALVAAQAPPSEALLTATKSGVLPYLPTNFAGVETLEGAIIYDGPSNLTVTGLYGNATTQQNNAGIVYRAILPSTNFDNLTGSTITGSITATVPTNGTGVQFAVNFTGFPAGYGPFVYHIHGLPVPANGNCTATLSHLDPTDRGEYYPCNPLQPQTCQTGDLSGKHGNITGTSYVANYSDNYISTNPDNSYYGFAGSVVIHSMNTTRLTCANWTFVSAGTSNYTNATVSSKASSIASSLLAVATAMPNGTANGTTNATATSAGASKTSTAAAGGATGSSSTGAASATSGSASGSAASTSAVATHSAAAVKNMAGAVLGGVAFVIGAVAL